MVAIIVEKEDQIIIANYWAGTKHGFLMCEKKYNTPVLSKLSDSEKWGIFVERLKYNSFYFIHMDFYTKDIMFLYANLFKVTPEFIYHSIINSLLDENDIEKLTSKVKQFLEAVNATPTQKLTIVNAMYEALCEIKSSTTS